MMNECVVCDSVSEALFRNLIRKGQKIDSAAYKTPRAMKTVWGGGGGGGLIFFVRVYSIALRWIKCWNVLKQFV